MTKPHKDYHDLFAQIPNLLWEKLSRDSDESGAPITRIVQDILRAHYKVPIEQLPKPRRAGRKPKK